VLYTLTVRSLLVRLGQRGLVVWGGALCCGAFTLIALSPVWQIAIPCTFVLGYSFFMLHNTVQTKASEMAPQARGVGMSLFASTWSLGQATGVAVMGLAVSLLDYAPAIIAFGVAFLTLGLWMRRNLERL
jgi:predicted MFS family arabinose efflux permease